MTQHLTRPRLGAAGALLATALLAIPVAATAAPSEHGLAHAGTAKPDPYGQTQSQGIPCDMAGGSSGGPWFTSTGAQNSVNSFGYTAVRNTMFGPYFGTAIQQAYQAAAN